MLRLRFLIDNEEKVLPLEGSEVRLGRGSDNDIVLPDFSVSRRHAVLRSEDGDWFVYDLDSTNGVQLNRVPVKKGPVRGGDRLKVGVFELDVEGDAVEPPPSVRSDESAITAIPNATIVRPLSDFSSEFGREGPAVERKKNDAAGAGRFFGFLTRLARDLIDTDSIDEVLRRIMGIAFEALPGVDRGFILLGQDSATIRCELARIGDQVRFRPAGEMPVSRTILDTVLKEQVALLTLDALDDHRLAGGESIRIHGIRAAMCAPLWSDEGISGFIQVDSPFHAGSFDEADLDFLIAVANYAAVAHGRIQDRHVRSRLERYHSPAVLEEVMREQGGLERRLNKADVTVLFADLVGFTAFTETAHLDDVMELLRGYLTRTVEAIFQEGGTLDKFIGDCVMAFFGAPMQQDDHALRCVRAAVRIQDAMDEWNEERRAQGLPEVQCRVAINSGPVVVGDVGSERRVDYTVLGNTVNVAARLEEAVAAPGDIVVGEETHRLLAGACEVELIGDAPLKGLQQRIKAYRVLR
jgi:adenylate cyclase